MSTPKFLLSTKKNTVTINIDALQEFFVRTEHVSPKAIALELENLKDTIVSSACDDATTRELKSSYKLVSDLAFLFREMVE